MKSGTMVRGTLDVVLIGAVTLGLVVLAGCGSSGSGSGGGGTTTPNGDKNIYVIEGSPSGASSILEFAAGSTGNVAPTATLNLPTNFDPLSVATDSSGQLYVGGENTENFEILVYASGSSGAATPTRTITTGSIFDASAIGAGSMTIDASGNLYVAGENANVAVYSPTANGSATPTQLISVGVLMIPLGIAVDSAGNIYVSNENETGGSLQGEIYEFAAGSTGNATPIRTITSPNIFYGIALDASGDIYANATTPVTDAEGDITGATAQIVEFSATATGAAAPMKSITMPSNGNPIVFAAGLRMDSAGDLFAAAQTVSSTSANATVATNVLEFAPDATGSATPTTNLSSSSWIYPGEELAID